MFKPIWRYRTWQFRLEAIRNEYKSLKFALLDLSFGFISLFMNPYRTCRKFLQKKGSDVVYAYGETPYSTYRKLAQECELSSHDTWVELGAGRGKGAFWLSHFIGCNVLAVEWVPSFVWIARFLKTLFRMQRLQFFCCDLSEVDLHAATIVYLYGPIRDVPSGVRLITISEPLPDYRILKSFWVRYPWGRTRAFLQIK